MTTPIVAIANGRAAAPSPVESGPAAEPAAGARPAGRKKARRKRAAEVIEKADIRVPAKIVAKPNRPAGRFEAPTSANPTFSLALPGPAPIGVPNFFIDKFRIPPFLLSIYQAAGIQYGVRWEVLAAINEIETDYGRNLNVSSAGALGWMQFMPATWKRYGTDANNDGKRDPYNPVDAIFAAARYLKAAGRRAATCRRRSSPTTTPTGTSTPSCCGHVSSAASRPTWSAR